MLRTLLLIIYLTDSHVQSVQIEYPPSGHITERIRTDLDSVDRIFRYYLVPREIQFHADALQGRLSFFLQCKGTTNTLNFTIPAVANDHLSLDMNNNTYTITATLRREKFRTELVGRYTCSEITNGQRSETSVYVFIQDGTSVFTKRLYPKVLRETGMHFFNLPCQTSSWFPRMSCPMPKDASQCKLRQCSSREREVNELKCNTPMCDGVDVCIPVYYTPLDLQPAKVFFDPQIGFALEHPNIPKTLSEFSCMSNYTPSQISKVPYDSFDPDYIAIHQSSLTIMSDETLRLSCEIQYGTKVGRKIPSIFWFEDIYNLNLIANETEKASFNPFTQVYNRNSSITLRGFKPDKSYRFYCVRVSEQGIYSRSVDIICVDKPSLDLEVSSGESDTAQPVSYGSDSKYDITIFTIPRSKIRIEITRNGISLGNDKRFVLNSISDRDNQFYEYELTIHNITFEDESNIMITAKSSASENTKIIKPTVTGNPVGQFSFMSNDIQRTMPWRDEYDKDKINIHTYGIYESELYRVVCTVRHRADIQQPLKVFIHDVQCAVDHCLSDIIDKTCQVSPNLRVLSTGSNRITSFQTQFVSTDAQIIDDPSIGHQYICCYEQNGLVLIAKSLTALARSRDMFTVHKPEFSLVTGDILKYRCEGHELIYDDLKMVYDDGLFTYERHRFDAEWILIQSKQPKQTDLEWLTPTSDTIRDTVIEVKTLPLRKIGKNGFIQCIALSKRLDVIGNMNDTYIIQVDDPVPLRFKTNAPTSLKLERKEGTNVEFDCSYDGQPKPKVTWLKDKVPLTSDDSTLQLRDTNGSIHITRVQTSDTGFYTCELINGRDSVLRRSFDLRVKTSYIYSKYRRLIAVFVILSACVILILLILLIVLLVKYYKMKKIVDTSIFHIQQPDEPEDKSKPPMSQLTRIRLPDNFASRQQVRTLLSYVNGDTLPEAKEDFKELGHGQYGIVYQIRLPEVGLVAAKLLPESIRNIERRRDKRKKGEELEESQEMIEKKHEAQKKKAAEMLIDEIKVMHKAGKHVNIVSLLKVAYPETKIKYVITGGLIRDEDSFYLMELCSNGSLESMLKRFLQPSTNTSETKLSLYETLAKQKQQGMTVAEANDSCILTEDDLTLIGYQVACGVDYLNRRQIAHCDIAARNVLVSSRFTMKICDFGLATWTTYKNYREQLAQNDSVQIQKKHNEIATHNLTPELARAILRASNPDERILLNKSSIKSDVWSFGIFLWTLFLKCRVRPFHQLLAEIENQPGGENFFHRLARVVSDGRVLKYLRHQQEIPGQIYAIIRECLVDENHRPEMTRIRALLCHSKMLSKQAFGYYRTEYNRYQEENATDEDILRFGDEQGFSELPSYDDNSNPSPHSIHNNDVTYRPTSPSDYYPTASDKTSNTYLSQSDRDYPQQENDSYLTPTPTTTTRTNDNNQQRTIAGNVSDKLLPLINKFNNIPIQHTTDSSVPRVIPRGRAPLRPTSVHPPPPPPPNDNEGPDSYV
ncbi:unnamed protein product [Rotaria socialis]|uniref:Receptor protein-tyrosine kinase n=1 Tax=Rotaria socialis TaxID=392032 RepID=A0A817QWT1_9BILA|nr:unnamed protein product [Rotaria socialis]CAF3391734.1 unnamed protein product [Rotaria socialis]CAF4151013.1 unnamed protein product [Rotaria socialis]CAF4295398.1 unnamed protein product [Rotaria socialis]